MSNEHVPSNSDQRNMAVREKLEALLPPTYSSATKMGWAEPDFGLAEVFTRYPRRRGNMIINLGRKALGRQDERYDEATRSARLGRLPEDWFGNTVPPRLAVYDTVYTPIDPVGGPRMRMFSGTGTVLSEMYFFEQWWRGANYDVAAGQGITKASAGGNRRTTIRQGTN